MCLSPLYLYRTYSEYEDSSSSDFVKPFVSHAWDTDTLKTVKHRYTFNPRLALNSKDYIPVPCGKCAECRKKARQDWSTRIQNEACMHERNCFITLTYKNDSLPLTDDGRPTLRYRDVQLFLKRLRKRLSFGVRFYCVGEYGARKSRPHYHIILFGCDFSDTRKILRKNGGFIDYIDQILTDCWPHGWHTLNDYTPSTANYVAGYVTKKLEKKEDYDGIEPEFHRMSRRDGLGKSYMLKNMKEVFSEHGFRIRCSNGFRLVSIPKRYIIWIKDIDVDLYTRTVARLTAFAKSKVQATFEELVRRKEYLEHMVKVEKRDFENGLNVVS